MKGRSYARWRLKSFGIAGNGVSTTTSIAILMPLTLWIPLVEIDGAYMKMWRELGGKWNASDYTTTEWLADDSNSELLTAHGLHELHVWAFDSMGYIQE
jgi:FAD/FMN-containing dehydrogenase